MIIKRLSYKSTFAYTFFGLLPLASAFLLTPVYTEYLTTSEYGTISLANVIQSYLAVAIGLGLEGAFSRYYFKYYQKSELVNALLSTTILFILGMSAVVFGFLYFFGDAIMYTVFKIDDFNFWNYGIIIFFTSLFSVLYTLLVQYFRDSESFRSFVILALCFFVAMTTGTLIGVVWFKAGVLGSLLGKLSGIALVMVVYLAIFLFKTGFIFKLKFCKNLLIFSLPLALYGLLGTMFDNLDRIYVEKNFTLDTLGQYNLALVAASVIGVCIQALMATYNPVIFKSMEKGKGAGEADVLNRAFRNIHFITVGLVIACIILSIPVIKIFINSDYHRSVLFIPLLALGFIFRAYYVIYSMPLFFHNKTTWLPLINGFSVVICIVTNTLLIPPFGIFGICIAVIITRFSQMAMTYFLIKQLGLYRKDFYRMGLNHLVSIVVIAATILGLCTYINLI